MLLVDELRVVQHRSPVCGLLAVIPVNHGDLVARVHRVIVLVFRRFNAAAAELIRKLRVFVLDDVAVDERHRKHVAALLDVLNTRLPKDIQRVNALDSDVAEPVVFLFVPEHAVDRHTVFELFPPLEAVCAVKFVVFHDDRQHGRERLRAFLVALLARQAYGLGVVVHRVGVLIHDRVKQPRTRRLGRFPRVFRPASDILPMPQLPPALLADDTVLEVALALLVLLQRFYGVTDLLAADGCAAAHRRVAVAECAYKRRFCLCIQHRSSASRVGLLLRLREFSCPCHVFPSCQLCWNHAYLS
nr:MAG: hypothetical protein [Bacteriophage sp.]